MLGAVIGALGLLVALGMARCLVAQWFHVPCPGCGTTRSVQALLRLDFPAVFRFNPLGPVQAALSGWVIARSLWVIARDGSLGALGYRGEGRRMLHAFFLVQLAELLLWGLRWFGLFGGPCPV